MAPKNSSGRVEDGGEGPDDGQEVIVADELLAVGLKVKRQKLKGTLNWAVAKSYKTRVGKLIELLPQQERLLDREK